MIMTSGQNKLSCDLLTITIMETYSVCFLNSADTCKWVSVSVKTLSSVMKKKSHLEKDGNFVVKFKS